MKGQMMVTGRTVWGPKLPTLKGTEVSLSYVQCFLYLVSSSINVSIFHITGLDSFWADLVYSITIWIYRYGYRHRHSYTRRFIDIDVQLTLEQCRAQEHQSPDPQSKNHLQLLTHWKIQLFLGIIRGFVPGIPLSTHHGYQNLQMLKSLIQNDVEQCI